MLYNRNGFASFESAEDNARAREVAERAERLRVCALCPSPLLLALERALTIDAATTFANEMSNALDARALPPIRPAD